MIGVQSKCDLFIVSWFGLDGVIVSRKLCEKTSGDSVEQLDASCIGLVWDEDLDVIETDNGRYL